MNPRVAFAFAWVSCAGMALAMALFPTAAAWVDGRLIPVGNDSFYHARRIFDMMAEPWSLHQFDSRVHVPDGSVLIWPWGYDYFMSLLTRAGLAISGAEEPIAVLARLPAFGFPVAILLTALICRRLQLGTGPTLVALLGMTFLPLNLSLYSVGSIDHHFAEQLLVLASLASGMGWLANPQSRLRAAATGLVLGLAVCIHNGLFVLQIPLMGALGLQWLRGEPQPKTSPVFAASLLISTLIAAAPSTSLRSGSFEFFTLSWFHVYFAACAACATLFLRWVSFSRRTLLLLGFGLIAVLAPVTSQLLLADRFLSVEVHGAQDISEVQSLLQLLNNRGNLRSVTNLYSFFIVLLPATLILCAIQALRTREAVQRYFWLASLAGLLMMFSMVRMHVFGTFALLLPWLVFIQALCAADVLRPGTARGALIVAGIAAAGSVVPAWSTTRVAGNDPYYALTHELYLPLRELCRRDPGVVLASPDDANYVRYHTDCSVIANNFLLTPLHEGKIREVSSLLALSPSQLPIVAPSVRYVLVHRMSLFTLKPDGRMQFSPGGNPASPDAPLVRSLIDTDPERLPRGFRLVRELAFEKPSRRPYARLFAVDRAASLSTP